MVIVIDILARQTISVIGGEADDAARPTDRNKKQAMFKNCVPFTNCITKIIHK